MADITASTALRDFIANKLSTAGGGYMWCTLHSATTGISASSVYATTGLSELSTGNGYTEKGASVGTITASAGVLDSPNVEWTTGAGQTLTAEACCLWVNDSNDIVGAALVAMDDSSQTASNEGVMTSELVNQITIPTPT